MSYTGTPDSNVCIIINYCNAIIDYHYHSLSMHVVLHSYPLQSEALPFIFPRFSAVHIVLPSSKDTIVNRKHQPPFYPVQPWKLKHSLECHRPHYQPTFSFSWTSRGRFSQYHFYIAVFKRTPTNRRHSIQPSFLRFPAPKKWKVAADRNQRETNSAVREEYNRNATRTMSLQDEIPVRIRKDHLVQ